MKIIVASPANVTPNIIRGAFHAMKTPNITVAAVNSPEKIGSEVTDGDMVIVDWEDEQILAAAFISAARAAHDKIPIFLLCPKSKANTTAAGLQAGANGILTKPVDQEELAKAVASAQRAAQARKKTLNVEFVNPFIAATVNVFKTMANMTVQRKRLFLKSDHKVFGDVSGIMGLSGTAHGSVVVSLPEKLACVMIGRLLNENPPEKLTKDVCDAVAEMINMIAGQAKVALAQTKYHFQLSIPSVIMGSGHEITHKQGTPCIVVIFETEGMEFAIQICLKPGEDEDAAPANSGQK